MRRVARVALRRLPRLATKVPRWLFVALAIYDIVQLKLSRLLVGSPPDVWIQNVPIYATYLDQDTSTTTLTTDSLTFHRFQGRFDWTNSSINDGTHKICWQAEPLLTHSDGMHHALHRILPPACYATDACVLTNNANVWTCRPASPLIITVETSQWSTQQPDVFAVTRHVWTAQIAVNNVVLPASSSTGMGPLVDTDDAITPAQVLSTSLLIADLTQTSTAMMVLHVFHVLCWCLCLLVIPSTSTGLTTMLHFMLESPLSVLLQCLVTAFTWSTSPKWASIVWHLPLSGSTRFVVLLECLCRLRPFVTLYCIAIKLLSGCSVHSAASRRQKMQWASHVSISHVMTINAICTGIIVQRDATDASFVSFAHSWMFALSISVVATSFFAQKCWPLKVLPYSKAVNRDDRASPANTYAMYLSQRLLAFDSVWYRMSKWMVLEGAAWPLHGLFFMHMPNRPPSASRDFVVEITPWGDLEPTNQPSLAQYGGELWFGSSIADEQPGLKHTGDRDLKSAVDASSMSNQVVVTTQADAALVPQMQEDASSKSLWL